MLQVAFEPGRAVLGALVIGTLVFTTTAHLAIGLVGAAGVIGIPLIMIILRTSRLDASAAERVREREEGTVLPREEFERVLAAPYRPNSGFQGMQGSA
jgi:hypothetical protein